MKPKIIIIMTVIAIISQPVHSQCTYTLTDGGDDMPGCRQGEMCDVSLQNPACVSCSDDQYQDAEDGHDEVVCKTCDCMECAVIMPDGDSTRNIGCGCDPGYYGSDNTCTGCPRGTYSATGVLSEHHCTVCSAAAWTAMTGSTMETDCNPSHGCAAGYIQRTGPPASCFECMDDFWARQGTMGSGQPNCDLCAPGFFKGASMCADCDLSMLWSMPENTMDDGGASTQCNICLPGQFATTATVQSHMECMDCSEGEWSSAGDIACTACPTGTSSAAKAGSGRECNKCAAGYYGATTTDIAATCTKCPGNSWSTVDANAALTNCDACAAGYYGTADAGGNNAATCVKCPPKTWKEAGGSNTAGFQLCIQCAAGFHRITGVSQVLGMSDYCVECPTGTWGIPGITMDTQCSMCAAGYHRNGGTKNNANGNSNSCMACPTGTWSSIDAADDSECNMCAVGYFGMRTNGVMATCQPCPIGTWNHKINQMEEAACNNCTGGKTTENNGTAAWAHCVCPPGTFQNESGSCEDCPMGQYNDMYNQTSCTLCMDGATTLNSGAASSTNCVCGVGEFLNMEGGCSNCSIGTYQSAENHRNGECSNCTGGTVTEGERAGECVCVEGQRLYNGQCLDCERGTYQKYAFHRHSMCSNCSDIIIGSTTNGTGATSYEDCGCVRGEYWSTENENDFGSGGMAGECLMCTMGTYQDETHHREIQCKNCSGDGVTHKRTTNILGAFHRDQCGCVQGQHLSGEDGCSVCEVGTFQNETFILKSYCKNCSDVISGSTTDRMGAIAEAECKCRKGEKFMDNSCVNCEIGTYKATDYHREESCQDCDPLVMGSTTNKTGATNETDCGCGAGEYLNDGNSGNSMCSSCQPGEYQALEFHRQTSCQRYSDDLNAMNARTTNGSGAMADTECGCGVGKYMNGRECTDCGMGDFRDESFHKETTCLSCSVVIAGSTTNGTGSTTREHCRCRQGHYVSMNGDERRCTPCAQGSYQNMDYHTETDCRPCTGVIAESTTMNTTSTASTDCVCVAGKYLDDANECTDCPIGTFQDSPFHKEATCKNCTSESTTGSTTEGTGSNSMAQCVCGPGYQLSGESCVQCEGNTVNPNYDAQCVACGAKTVANADKTTCETECPAGEELIGDTCTACQSGFYKSKVGNQKCTRCPTNTEAIQAADRTTCQCVAGTEGDGLTCTQCIKSYHPGGRPGTVTCTQCPDNTFAPDGSTSADDCEAPPAVTTTVPGNLVIDNVERDECIENDYENPASEGYMRVTGAVSRRVLDTFRDVIDVEFTDVRCGSVDVDYQMVFATPTPPAPTQLAQMLQQSIQTNGLVSQDGTNFTIDAASIVFEEPIRPNEGKNNSWVFIIVGGVGVIIVGVVAVLFIYKVRPECMFHDPERVRRQYEGADLHRERAIGRSDYDLPRERPPIGRGHLGDDWKTRSRTYDRYSTRPTTDLYKNRMLDNVRRSTYRNSTYTSPYYKYGY